jgi:hypothetical protein
VSGSESEYSDTKEKDPRKAIRTVLHKPDSSRKHHGALDVIKKLDRKEEQRRSRKLLSDSEPEDDFDTDDSVDDKPRSSRKIAKSRRRVKSYLDDEAKEDRKTRQSYSILSYKPRWKFVKHITNDSIICSFTDREEIYTDFESGSKEKKRKEPTQLARKSKDNF